MLENLNDVVISGRLKTICPKALWSCQFSEWSYFKSCTR